MKYQKQIAIVKKLIENTEIGKLTWAEAPTPKIFQVSLPQYTVQIAREPQDTIVIIRDSAGETIEKYTSRELAREWPIANSVMDELYVTVRRKALGVDKALDNILNELL